MKILYFILAFIVMAFLALQNMAWDANRPHPPSAAVAPLKIPLSAKDDLSELFINHSEADIDAEKTLAEFKKTRHEENLMTKKQRQIAFNKLFRE